MCPIGCRSHGSLIATLSGHTSWVLCVAFSPDNEHFVSGSSDRTVKVWEVATKQCVHTFSEHSDQVQSSTLNFRGNLNFPDFTFRLRFLTDEPLSARPQVWSVAYNPDGDKIISVSEDKNVLVYDAVCS